MERRVTATEAKTHFGELMRRVVEERTPVVVERGGRPLVVVISFEEYARLTEDEHEPGWRALLRRTRDLIRDETAGTPRLPVDDLIQEMRDERDAQLLSNLR